MVVNNNYYMQYDQKFFFGTIILMIFIFLVSLIRTPTKVTAATTNQTNVTVQIAQISEITVVPTIITWSNIVPGSVGGIVYLDIKNSGSQDIQKVYGYADTLVTEPSNPIPDGLITGFSSGSVLMFKKNETGASYYYVDRLEWNITEVKPGVEGPPGSSTTGGDIAVVWGYYRNATPGGNFLYYLVNGTEINATHGCNSTGSKIMIEQEADNGTAATRNPDLGGTITVSTPDWGIYNYSSGPLAGHCVALHRTCEKILIYRYDRRNTGNTQFNSCELTDDEQSFRTTVLHPGDEFTVNLDAWVPEGVPYGWMTSSWLTIEAG
jgi:hypothetical protein